MELEDEPYTLSDDTALKMPIPVLLETRSPLLQNKPTCRAEEVCVCVCPSSIYFLRFSSSPALYPFSPFLFNNIKLSFFQQPESWITFKLWIQTFLMLRILTIEISSTCIKISSTCPVSSIRPSTAILC